MLGKLRANYFNRYQFFVSGYNIKNMHGLDKKLNLMYDLKQTYKSKTCIRYEFIPKIEDPVKKLLCDINDNMPIEKLRVSSSDELIIEKIDDNSKMAIVYSFGLVPTHYMLYARDLFQKNECHTWISNDYCHSGKFEPALLNPFERDIFVKTYHFGEREPYYKNMINETDVLYNKSLISKFFEKKHDIDYDLDKEWDFIEDKTKKHLLTNFYNDYTKKYVFTVDDALWDSYDGVDSTNFYNKCAQFMNYSKYFHSLIGGVYPNYTAEGGLVTSVYCPGLDFIDNESVSKIIGYKPWPDNCEIRGNKQLYARRKIPYWKLIYLRQAIEDFGIRTKNSD